MITFQPTYSSSGPRGGQRLTRKLRELVWAHPGQDAFTGPLTHTHPPQSDWDNSDMPVHLMWTYLGWGRKLEPLEKSPCKLEDKLQTRHRQWPSGKWIPFFLINPIKNGIENGIISESAVKKNPLLKILPQIQTAHDIYLFFWFTGLMNGNYLHVFFVL